MHLQDSATFDHSSLVCAQGLSCVKQDIDSGRGEPGSWVHTTRERRTEGFSSSLRNTWLLQTVFISATNPEGSAVHTHGAPTCGDGGRDWTCITDLKRRAAVTAALMRFVTLY